MTCLGSSSQHWERAVAGVHIFLIPRPMDVRQCPQQPPNYGMVALLIHKFSEHGPICLGVGNKESETLKSPESPSVL